MLVKRHREVMLPECLESWPMGDRQHITFLPLSEKINVIIYYYSVMVNYVTVNVRFTVRLDSENQL